MLKIVGKQIECWNGNGYWDVDFVCRKATTIPGLLPSSKVSKIALSLACLFF
jgi:hypothetical protein